MSDAAGAASSRPLLMVSGFALYGFGRVSGGDWSSRTPGGFKFFYGIGPMRNWSKVSGD